MNQCWPFPGAQQNPHFRAFANSFQLHPGAIRHPLVDSRNCPINPLPCPSEWRLAAKAQVDQWALQAAAAVAAAEGLPRRFPPALNGPNAPRRSLFHLLTIAFNLSNNLNNFVNLCPPSR